MTNTVGSAGNIPGVDCRRFPLLNVKETFFNTDTTQINSVSQNYHKVPKFWDARYLCCNLHVPKSQTKRPNPKGYFVKMVQME